MPQRLIDMLNSLGRPKLMVVGDMILDRYLWGDVSRISPEAPIQVLEVLNEETKLGGAASVVNNLAALEVDVLACGVLGDDEPGRLFRRMLNERGLDDAGLIIDRSRRTTLKTRMIACKQQVLRVDHEDTGPLGPQTADRVKAFVRGRIDEVDLVIISDYGKGLITPGLTGEIARLSRKRGVLVIADTFKQPDFSRYQGLSAITPNRSESELATGLKVPSVDAAGAAARKLIDDLKLDAVVMTLDREGLAVLERDKDLVHIPTRPRAVWDVTGAGDMVISVLGAALAAGNSYADAARLANVAAGLEVERIGVQPLTRADVLKGIRSEYTLAADKVLTQEELLAVLDEHRRRSERIVFTNGCFDVLHLGHVKYLEFARGLGDVLVVGLNSDASVRKLKGPGRPVCDQNERAQVLAALADVSYVVLFEEEVPERIIRKVRPDVLVKGEDWREKGVVGREFVESCGGEVVLAPVIEGKSTSDIIRRIKGEDKSS